MRDLFNHIDTSACIFPYLCMHTCTTLQQTCTYRPYRYTYRYRWGPVDIETDIDTDTGIDMDTNGDIDVGREL